MTGASYELRAKLRSSSVRIFLVRKQQQDAGKSLDPVILAVFVLIYLLLQSED